MGSWSHDRAGGRALTAAWVKAWDLPIDRVVAQGLKVVVLAVQVPDALPVAVIWVVVVVVRYARAR